MSANIYLTHRLANKLPPTHNCLTDVTQLLLQPLPMT